MKKGDTSKWRHIESCENLLFFSQLVNELLFDYSIPSNRVSTLNSHYLVEDAINAIGTIEKNGVPEGTLKPIVEELYNELDKEVIFPNKEPLNYFIKMQGGSLQIVKPKDLNYHEEVKCVKAIDNEFFSNNSYYETLKREIIKRTKSNDLGEQQELFRLTKTILTELMNSGYSLKYIYMIMEKLLWKPEHYIESSDIIEDFFDAFDFMEKEFTIAFKVNWRKMNSFITQVEGWDFSDDLSEDVIQKVDKRFAAKRPDEKFLVFKSNGLDPYSAAERSISLIESNTSVFRLYNHGYRYDIRNVDYRVYDNEKTYKKGKSIKAVEHTRMLNEEQIKEGTSFAVESINGLFLSGHYTDYRSLLNAVKYHAHSLDSRAEENQLLDLWAIFESVLDISNKHSSERINQVCDYLVPILKHKYIYSLFNQLAEDIRSYDSEWFDNYVSNKQNKIQSIAEFVLLEEYENERKDFYKKCNDFPLLKERIQYYNKTLKIKQDVYEYVEKHAIRVRWQVMRIYRNRNLIIHNAKNMPYLKLLIENLHSYVDDFIEYVIYASAQKKDISSMCQELFVKECKWHASFRRGRDILTKEDIECMLTM